MLDIKKLRELRKKATPGLLRVVGRDSWRLTGFPQVEFNAPDQKYFTVHCEADARYLAAAWNILPEALDEIERLEKALKSAEEKRNPETKKNNFTCSSCERNFIEEEMYPGNTCFSCFRSADP